MSRKEKNMFERIAESLAKIAEELSGTNNYLFGIGAELADLNLNLQELKELISTLLKEPLKVTVDTESLSKMSEKQSESIKSKQPQEAKFEYKVVK